MRQSLKINIAILCLSVFIIRVWAIEGIDNKKVGLFPNQTPLVYDDSYILIDPFKMVSWSVGKNWVRYHRDFKKDFRKTAKELKWFKNHKTSNFDLKTEVPYYRDIMSLGFDLCLVWDHICEYTLSREIEWMNFTPEDMLDFNTQAGRAKVLKKQKFIAILSGDQLDEDSQFAYLMGLDFLGVIKFKLPFKTRLGRFALTFAPKLGVKFIHDGVGYNTITSLPIGQLGTIIGASTGIDYYFNQWLGVYAEFSLKHNSIKMFIPYQKTRERIEEESPIGFKREILSPYSYFSTNFTFGFKTTF